MLPTSLNYSDVTVLANSSFIVVIDKGVPNDFMLMAVLCMDELWRKLLINKHDLVFHPRVKHM